MRIIDADHLKENPTVQLFGAARIVDIDAEPTVDVLEQIKEEIEQVEINGYIRDVECFRAGINTVLNIIDKYRGEQNDNN